jgi:ABC-type spermidine/putrescine transport system permease subunit I
MRGTIKRLLGSSVFLVLCSAASLYLGSRKAAGSPTATAANEIARQFGGDPGDGWMLAGGLLMLVALAFASAGAMLWFREREG